MSVREVHALLQSKLEKRLLRGTHFINVDDWSENEISTKYKRVIGIVDCLSILGKQMLLVRKKVLQP
jgi:hypothetical protein